MYNFFKLKKKKNKQKQKQKKSSRNNNKGKNTGRGKRKKEQTKREPYRCISERQRKKAEGGKKKNTHIQKTKTVL